MLKIGIVGNNVCVDDTLMELRKINDCTFVGCYSGFSVHEDIVKFKSIEALIANSDGIIILQPNAETHHLTEKVVRHQIPCFIESPFAPSYEKGKSFMNLVHEAKIIAQVSNPDRFNKAFATTLPYFKEPMFIESSRLASLNEQNKELSVILNLMIYDIDIILSVVKSGVKKIHAVGLPVLTNSPDIVNARIEFENGCVANLTASRMSLTHEHKSRFFQRNAYISVDYLQRTSSIFELSNKNKDQRDQDIAIKIPGEGSKYVSVKMPEKNDNPISELEHFIITIKSESTSNNFSHCLSALEVAYQINEKVQLNTHLMV